MLFGYKTRRQYEPYALALAVQIAVVGGAGVFAVCLVLIAARRAMHGPPDAFSPLWLLLVGVLIALFALALNRAGILLDARHSRAWSRANLAASLLAILVVGWAVTTRRTPLPALAVFWTIALASEVTLIVIHRRTFRRPALADRPGVGGVRDGGADGLELRPAGEASEAPLIEWRQTITPADETTIHGTAHVRFQPGQRTGVLHLSFCPPMAARPDLEIRQIGGPESRIKTTLIEPFGARLELRLNQAQSQASRVTLRFVVQGRFSGSDAIV